MGLSSPASTKGNRAHPGGRQSGWACLPRHRRREIGRRRGRQAQDRKSTRLNSSDGYISYAVFCLKKKKQAGSSTVPCGDDTRSTSPLATPSFVAVSLGTSTHTSHVAWVIMSGVSLSHDEPTVRPC